MNNTIVIEHPILKEKLSVLRDKNSRSDTFRNVMDEMSRLIAYEATRELALQSVEIETPLEKMVCSKIANYPIVVSVLRAGSGMLGGILSILPGASAGHIGIYRDKFIKNTVEYYFKIPEKCENKDVLLADPLLATADTAIACIDRLKQYNVGKISFLCVLASSVGIERLHYFHPDVKIYTLSIERELNENGYLLPGLGDAGDRLFQTK